MIAADERLSVRQPVRESVPERRSRPRHMPASLQQLQVGVEPNLPESDHHSNARKRVELRFEVRQAVADFFGRRVVVGRGAANGRRDISIAQRQPVVAILRGRDVRVAGAMQCRHEEVARAADPIAREHAAGPIGAVGGRREADDQQPGEGIAEAGNRPGPVDVVAVHAPLLASDARAVGTQTGTPFAGDDLIVNRLQAGSVLHPPVRPAPKDPADAARISPQATRRAAGPSARLPRTNMLAGIPACVKIMSFTTRSVFGSSVACVRRPRSIGRGCAARAGRQRKGDKNERIRLTAHAFPRSRQQITISGWLTAGGPISRARRQSHAAASDAERRQCERSLSDERNLGRETHCPERCGELDAVETQEWLESLDYVLQTGGPGKVARLLRDLTVHATENGVKLPFTANTPYINTIPADDQVPMPGSREIERRIKSMIRWNATAMVVRANKANEGIGGHISTFASAATLYEVGFNHFFRGHDGDHGDSSTSGSRLAWHLRAGVSRRPDRRDQLANFRHELNPGGGLSSYPHPWLMPDFWEYPTVSMGLGPIMAIYQARFIAVPRRSRPQAEVERARSGHFSATAKPTSPKRWARSRCRRARSSTT